MLRSAIFIAIGALFLALLAPNLLPLFLPGATQDSRPAAAAPLRADVALSAPAPTGYSETSLDADAGGQYAAGVQINGQNVRMLVDTGATMVVISYDTALRLGLRPVPARQAPSLQVARVHVLRSRPGRIDQPAGKGLAPRPPWGRPRRPGIGQAARQAAYRGCPWRLPATPARTTPSTPPR